MRERLRRAESEEEKEAVIKEYSDKMAAAQDDIEQQKQKKLRDVRKLLKEERKRRKKELYKYGQYYSLRLLQKAVKLGEKEAQEGTLQVWAILFFKMINIVRKYQRKIPMISPGLIIVQQAFLLGLFLVGLIFGGAYYWRAFCVSK